MVTLKLLPYNIKLEGGSFGMACSSGMISLLLPVIHKK